jgi:L-arabinonolactonase
MTPSVALVPGVRDGLGESPLWDPDEGVLYRVDSLAPAIHRLDPAAGAGQSWTMPLPVGSIGLGPRGSLIAALADGFHRLDLARGTLSPIWTTTLPPGTRLNDGKMDRDGRYLCGTMQVEDGAPPGVLYRLSTDGACEVLEHGIGIANATCFSPDGMTLYFTDSRAGAIWAYPYDRAGGPLGERRVLAELHADGATVDAEGFIWAALVRSGQLARVAPDGRLDRMIDLPVPHPTCPAFGGAGLDALYITSISRSKRIRSEHPEAGRLVVLTGLGVRGLPEARFAA